MSLKTRCCRLGSMIPMAGLWIAIAATFAGTTYSQDREVNSLSVGRKLISKKSDSMRMVINTSQNIALEKTVDLVYIHNNAILQATPQSHNEVLISALATGVSRVDFKTKDDETYSLDVVVVGDGRELQAILNQNFPTAVLTVQPIQQAVIISGQVTADEHVEQVVKIAEQYYPNVINKIEVIGVHTIMLQIQVMEVSRTKLRNLGFDWQMGFGNDFVTQSASGLIGRGATTGALVNSANETFKFGILEDNNSFFVLLRALKQNNMAKVLADPTVVAIDGRPASFNSGGEFPILVPAGLGQVAVEFREFGTRVDFVGKVRGDGRIWLEVRPTISEIDPGRSVVLNGTSIPGIRSRFVETAVELRAGETLALAGLLQMRTEAECIGLPVLSDVPYLGALFRANREVQNEVELLILVTPNFAAPMQPHEVPPGGPGYNSGSPTDRELYWKGYIEVPPTCGQEGCNGNCVTPNTQAVPNPYSVGSNAVQQPARPQFVPPVTARGPVPVQQNVPPVVRR